MTPCTIISFRTIVLRHPERKKAMKRGIKDTESFYLDDCIKAKQAVINAGGEAYIEVVRTER